MSSTHTETDAHDSELSLLVRSIRKRYYDLDQLIQNAVDAYGVPAHTAPSLVRYIYEGCPVGGFLTAVLSNDLAGACGKADLLNQRALFEIVAYVYNRVPSVAWGSRERVEAWIEAHAIEAHALERKREQEQRARQA